jgi:hypothetical protein
MGTMSSGGFAHVNADETDLKESASLRLDPAGEVFAIPV